MALSAMRSGRVSACGAQARIRSVAVRPSVQRPSSRSPTVSVKAFFSFLQPKAPASSAKAAELAEELIELVSSKRASAADVNKLVSELQPFGIKNPVRSKQLFGTYKLVYTSKAGGSTNVTQVLEEPDQVREVTEVKVLGLLSGTQTTSGELNGVSGDTYEELYDKVEVKAPVGGESRSVDKARLVQVLYLDQELRVVRVKEEGEAGDGAMLVYQRVAEDGEEDEEEQGGKQQGGAAALFGFGASGAKEGTATIAEREVLRKMAAAKDAKGAAKPAPRLPANLPSSPAAAAAARGGTVKVGPPTARANSPAPPAARGGTVKVEAKPSADAQRREAEAKAKAKEAALAKEKAEADKRAAAERQASIKAQLEQLSEQLREAQAEARDAAKEAKDLERANGAVLKQVAGARLQIRSATDEVEKVEEQLAQATQARAAAEQALKQALAGVSEAKARSSRK